MRLLCVFFTPGFQICMIMNLVVWASVEHCFTSREQCFTHFLSLLNQSQGPIIVDSNPGLCKKQRLCERQGPSWAWFFHSYSLFFLPGRDRCSSTARSSLVFFHLKRWQQQTLKYWGVCMGVHLARVVWNLLDAYFDRYEHLSKMIPYGIKSLKHL